MLKPNFFHVGVPKAGSKSLWRWFGQVPGVLRAREDEIRYYLDPDNHSAGWLRHLSYNYRHYNGGPTNIIFEAHPDWLFYEYALKNLAAVNPEAKILVSLREPWARTVSAYWHSVNYLQENRNLQEALQQSPPQETIAHHSAFPRPLYLTQSWYSHYLPKLFHYFPREQVKIIIFEEMLQNWPRVASEILSFAGLPLEAASMALPHANEGSGCFVDWLSADDKRNDSKAPAVGLCNKGGYPVHLFPNPDAATIEWFQTLERNINVGAASRNLIRGDYAFFLNFQKDFIEDMLGRKIPLWLK